MQLLTFPCPSCRCGRSRVLRDHPGLGHTAESRWTGGLVMDHKDKSQLMSTSKTHTFPISIHFSANDPEMWIHYKRKTIFVTVDIISDKVVETLWMHQATALIIAAPFLNGMQLSTKLPLVYQLDKPKLMMWNRPFRILKKVIWINQAH